MASEMMDGFIAGKMDSGNGNGCCYPMMPMWGMPYGMGMGMGMGGWGMGGMWEWFPMLIIAGLLFGNGFGFGGGFGGSRGDCGCATQADLAAGFNNSAVLNKLNDITIGQANAINYNNQGFSGLNTAVLQGFHGVDNAVCTLGYQAQQGFSGLSRELADCCCTIERGIDRNTTQGVMNTNAIQQQISACCCDLEKMNMQNRYDAQTANCGTLQAIDKLGDRIIGYLSNQETQNLRDEVQSYRLQASQAKQNQYLIDQLRPCPVPAYLTCNPYAASYGLGNGAYNYGRSDGYGCGCGCAA